MLTSLLLSVTTFYVSMTSCLQTKETLTFVMMTKTTGINTRTYTNNLRNTASKLNSEVNMAWHSRYQLQTRYGHISTNDVAQTNKMHFLRNTFIKYCDKMHNVYC